jgi:hypothetical protein
MFILRMCNRILQLLHPAPSPHKITAVVSVKGFISCDDPIRHQLAKAIADNTVLARTRQSHYRTAKSPGLENDWCTRHRTVLLKSRVITEVHEQQLNCSYYKFHLKCQRCCGNAPDAYIRVIVGRLLG